MEFPLDLLVILAVIQVTLCVLTFFFGFKKPEPPVLPIDFDWKKEGF
jgi:hypothetical protein